MCNFHSWSLVTSQHVLRSSSSRLCHFCIMAVFMSGTGFSIFRVMPNLLHVFVVLLGFRPQGSWSDFSCPVCFKRWVGTTDLGSNHPCDYFWSSKRSFTFFSGSHFTGDFTIVGTEEMGQQKTKSVLNKHVWCLVSFSIVFLVFRIFE